MMALKAARKYRIKPHQKVKLEKIDADDTSLFKAGKAKAESQLHQCNQRLDELQDLLYAGHEHKVLIVLQGMDTAGKDGTIRHVFGSVDPLGVSVASFKVPTEEELDHDFLWRVHRKVPGKGEFVIFNRSHYEDVLVVRVRKLTSEKVWKKRYRQIREFERLLSETGTILLKLYLHIDREEQAKRLQQRLDDPAKMWKFRLGDIEERKYWDAYMEAYEDAIRETTTEYAPWYVIPANAKWYRNLVVSDILVESLERLKMKYPEPREDLSGARIV